MTSSPLSKRNPVIEDFVFPPGLPTADDLPCSDGKPVDSELQDLLPSLLQAILFDLWRDRPRDWLFSIDMGFYHTPHEPAISPDGMLSMGIAPVPSENLRSSYVLWQEKVLPLFVLEVVSKTPGKERTRKREIYELVGILYYLVYAPLSQPPKRFQLYKLVAGEYVLQTSAGMPSYWMPELGLGIGAERRLVDGIKREWLFWYDEAGDRHPTPSDRAELEAQKASLESQRANLEAQARLEESQRADSEAQRANLEAQARREESQRADSEFQRANLEAQARREESQRADSEAQRANLEAQARREAEQAAEALRQKLLSLGIDPDLTE
jgi:Uma2 family endonuclease